MASLGNGRRILIGAGCFADAEAAFRLVEPIPEKLPLELSGLLVDEGFIEDFVRSPMQKVVTPGGKLKDPPTAQRARALLERDTRAFRRMLSATAEAGSVKWSFEKRSGDLIRHAFDAASEWDILLLGRRTLHRRSGQVVIVSGDLHLSERAQKTARNLANEVTTDHVTLAISQNEAPEYTENALFILEKDESSLLRRLNRMNASTVVVDLEAGHRWSSDLIRQLLEAARCPLVILGPEPANDPPENSATDQKKSNSKKTQRADE